MKEQTKQFIEEVKILRQQGAIRFDADIYNEIGMKKPVFSMIINGKRNITEEYYDKFKEVFGTKLQQTSPLPTKMLNIMYVPLVNKYAYAGYLSGYGDVEYVGTLPTIPMIADREHKGNYVAFEVNGDSMDDGTPSGYVSGEIVICREIGQQHWSSKLHIKKYDFVIVHKTEGITLKKIKAHDVQNGILTLHPLNTMYDEFDVNLNDVAQIFNVIQSFKDR